MESFKGLVRSLKEQVDFKVAGMKLAMGIPLSGRRRGVGGSVIGGIILTFIAAVIAVNLLGPYANAVGLARINNNVTVAPGGQVIVDITTTLFAVAILGLFLAGF